MKCNKVLDILYPQFTSYREDVKSMRAVGPYQLTYLALTDKAVALRECSRLIGLASAVCSIAAHLLSYNPTTALYTLAGSGVAWLLSRKLSASMEPYAKNMIQDFKNEEKVTISHN